MQLNQVRKLHPLFHVTSKIILIVQAWPNIMKWPKVRSNLKISRSGANKNKLKNAVLVMVLLFFNVIL